jgi:DNA-binding NarL/FixJ family response regulator
MSKGVAVPLRVAVIEDDARYRASLEQLFRHSNGFSLAGSYGSPSPALSMAEQARRAGSPRPWDVVVMDIEMPLINGIDGTQRLKAIFPDIRIVVLTVFEEASTILEAICAGADGYLLKKSRARDILEGLQAVTDGGAPLTPIVARSVLRLVKSTSPAGALSAGHPPTRLDLSEREQQVLRALVEGLSYKQAGDVIGISLGTVRGHITSVYRKLQVHSVAEAVTRALRDRLV